MSIHVNLNEELKDSLLEKSVEAGMTVNQLVIDLLEQQLQKTTYLTNGYYFINNTLYNNNMRKINLTVLEYELFVLLLKSKDTIVLNEVILEKLCTTKKMSVFSLRNLVHRIRQKTHQNIIKCSYGIGYYVN